MVATKYFNYALLSSDAIRELSTNYAPELNKDYFSYFAHRNVKGNTKINEYGNNVGLFKYIKNTYSRGTNIKYIMY